MLFFQMYSSVQFHIASKCTKYPFYQMRQNQLMQNILTSSQNCLTYCKNSVIMNLFSIENVYLFPEVAVGVVK